MDDRHQEKISDLQRALSGAMREKDDMRRMLEQVRGLLSKAMADNRRLCDRDRSFERDIQREFGRLGVWCDDVTDPVMLRGCVDLQLRHLEAVGDRLQRFERVWWRRAWRWAMSRVALVQLHIEAARDR